MPDDPYFSDMLPKLRALVAEFAPKLGLEDQSDLTTLGEALVVAYDEGRQAGEAEIMAQAVEQGVDVTVRKVPRPDPSEG